MLLLTSTSDLVQVITGSASTINVHASYMDNASGTITPIRTNTATITTGTTTTVVSSPASSTQRNVRHLNIANVDASNSCAITVQHTDGTTVEPLFTCTLLPGEELIFSQGGQWLHYDKFGGIYQGSAQSSTLYNNSTASQGAGFSTDTYLTGSNILLPSSRPKVGTEYRCRFHMSKTAAGTATPIFTLRYGTTASVSDAAALTFTFAAGTAAADAAIWEVYAYFRTVGSGTNAVLTGACYISQNILASTGFTSVVKVQQANSSGFDSTTANTYLGLSVNGGASAAWTSQFAFAYLDNF